MGLALTAFHVAIMVIAGAIFIAAAVNDACSYRIPNYMCALLLGMFPFFVATEPYDAIDWHQNVMIFALVAVSGFGMFLGKLAGAGDIKLLAVAALWAGPHLIAVLLVVTAIAGGILSLVMAAIIHRKHRDDEDRPHLNKVPIPYGIAIAMGGVTTLVMMAQPILLPG